MVPRHAGKLPLHFFFINCWLSFKKKKSYLRGHSRTLGTGQVGEGSGPGGTIQSLFFGPSQEESCRRGIWVCRCHVVCFPYRTIFDSSFRGIRTEKQQREHFKKAAALSCCSDNGGVIGNHLCKLWCPLSGACQKCGNSFLRLIFFSPAK